jgi:endogenous inhibitor of DNA gyrase (YacG/DUF329 family)
MSTTVRLVPCPTCKTPTAFTEGNRWRPFCSERCRNADLGAWASENYRMPAGDADPGDDKPSPIAH